MAENLVDEAGDPITEDAEITKYRLSKISAYSKKIVEYLEKKNGVFESYKSLKDGSVTLAWQVVEGSPGSLDKAIAEFKEAIVAEASKL